MNGKEHLLFGYLAGVVLAVGAQILIGFQGVKQNLALIPIIYVFTLLPDIDHKMSSITWNFFAIAFSLLLVGLVKNWNNFLVLGTIFFGLTVVAATLFKHRGITHSVVWVFFSPFLLLLLDKYITITPFLLIVAGVSYWVHLICDGIPLKVSFKSWSGSYDNKFRIL